MNNALVGEKSPYLLQHAHNPVNWLPWSGEAFAQAAREDKPIFLSIGYSTCHWCHVMAHESFEDAEVARILNDSFVSIKVDREERPDIDGVYMTVCQMMSGSGGWPLTIIMTPDKKPFFAATYIPKESRFGRVGLLDLLPRIAGLWREKRGRVDAVAEEVVASLKRAQEARGGEGAPEASVYASARRELSGIFDEECGGFGNAPKFPNVPHLLFLLGEWRRNGDEGARRMVERTLEAMSLGGIHDHLGFGFHRYSTDRNWLVPHFEKMLYDQALLLMAYSEAFQAWGDERHGETALAIVSYVLRALRSPEGGFYSAEDADSEGEEGRFYLWKTDEIEALLPPDVCDIAKRIFGLEREGNYADEILGGRNGSNILRLKEPLAETAPEMGMTAEELARAFRAIRETLFSRRERRPKPHRDDKILTDWNGLMIAALAMAGRIMNDARSIDAATRAARFILDAMRSGSGRLFHRYQEGERAFAGTLDDYAFFTWGLLELYESTFEESYLGFALELTDTLIARFRDPESGGFFVTADDAEQVLVRRMEFYDGAVPSGNAVCLLNIARLALMSGDERLSEMSERLVHACGRAARNAPTGCAFSLNAAEFAAGRAYDVVIVGLKASPDTERMVGELRRRYVPNKTVLLMDPGRIDAFPPRIARRLRNFAPSNGKTACYICADGRCLKPVTETGEMLRALGLST